MKVLTAPETLIIQSPSIFLAGSIDQDKADNWQKRVIQAFSDFSGTLLNPRRASWNAEWEQSIHHPAFREQVEWELDALEKADKILLYFDPQSLAPISLLELGLFARSQKIYVCCPDGYWRKGNVDIICNRYEIPQYPNLEDLVSALTQHLTPNPST
ncbi:MAG: nucleoside 2-deoxyribosyltransferase domain-containing protein [Bacteroidota bacterium]